MNEKCNDQRWSSRLLAVMLSPVAGGPCAVVLFALAGVLTYRQSRLVDIPDIGDPIDPEGIAARQVDPAENAASDYEAAFSMLRMAAEPERSAIDVVLSDGWEKRTRVFDYWLRDNDEALHRWRQGTERRACQRMPLDEFTTEYAYVPIADSITLSRLAALKALQTEAAGDPCGAWQWHRAHFRFSRHVGMFGPTIDRTVGSSLHWHAVRSIVRWAGNDEVSELWLATALADVRSDYELTAPHSIAVRAEYFIMLDQLNHLDATCDAWQEVSAMFGTMATPLPNRFERFLNNEPEVTRRLLRHQVANLLSFFDRPEADRPALVPGAVVYFDQPAAAADRYLDPARFAEAVDSSAVARHLLLRNGDAGAFATREGARQRLLETILAAEHYRRVHRTFPATIADLVDAGLLEDIPSDPTSPTGAELRFERDPDDPQRARVWSVGQNGVDNGGNFEVIAGEGPADIGYSIGTRTNAN